jgi:hypothetical protein
LLAPAIAFKLNNYYTQKNRDKMDLDYMHALPAQGGFNYDNCLRNKALTANKGMGLQTNIATIKTGTTICGVIFKVSGCPSHSPVALTKIFRTELLSLLTQEPPAALWLATRTARRFTTLRQTFSAVAQVLLPTATTSLK